MPDIFINPNPSAVSKKELPKEPEKPTKRKNLASFLRQTGGGAFSAFSLGPKKVVFETQDSEEEILVLLRRHPITNVKWIVVGFLLLLTPFIMANFPILDFLPKNFQFIAILIWYLITLAYILENFIDWFFNVYIITDERIIDVDFYNLIYKEVSDANIDKIQDVTYKMGGVVRTMFNYGDVLIQTASEVPNFVFEAVPKPDEVAKILQDLRLAEERENDNG